MNTGGTIATATHGVVALDIGGANLKIADGRELAISRPFPLWKSPDGLSAALAELLAHCPAACRVAVTMTGELADCYATKSEGVRRIISAVQAVTTGHELRVYLCDGSLAGAEEACERPLLAAASNWHILAAWAAQRLESDGLLIDMGSTTTDIIPLISGRPAARGRTDPERLIHGELVYTGVLRSPVCAISRVLPWRGAECPTAQEWFATSRDAHLLLGNIPEEPDSTETADGRPATLSAAWDRLARTICADRTMFSVDDARRAAQRVVDDQLRLLVDATRQVVAGMPRSPQVVVTSGQGEFLARQAAETVLPRKRQTSISQWLDSKRSQVAPAHALAQWAAEHWTP